MKSIKFIIAAMLFSLTVAFFAFKSENKKARVMYTFYYNGPDYSATNVQDESQWSYTSSTTLCEFINEKACRLQIDQTYVDNTGATPILKSTANISAAIYNPGTDNTAYVVSTADGSAVISNTTN